MPAPGRWDDISRIYHAALELPAGKRAAYLKRACHEDVALLRELESLLHCAPEAERFMPAPAFEAMTAALAGTISTPGRFDELRQAFETAMNRPAAERLTFLEHAYATLIGEPDRESAAQNVSGTCSSCGGMLGPADRFCRACGNSRAAAVAGPERRFPSGTVFAGRFRIITALGRGGMGDVYRAEDLQLNQQVALKFLTAVRRDDQSRNRLRNEVRLARQIAHPNVCRVYDIGEWHGELYLSMEYVDGEDLAALLERIGRLGADKAIDVARQLAAGLAAAHAKGVLHRDLKPRNVMIDSRGDVRIMDFGIATSPSEALDDRGVGTPGYMAPEQLAGREATALSDIYSLGLVLYELFTGRRPFDSRNVSELLRLRDTETAPPPSTHVPDIEPAIDRVIMRCLEADPRLRPPSALGIVAALPGGDPLAAALAMGETPSPEIVAAAGPVGAVRLRVAVALLSCAGVALAVAFVLTPRTQAVSMLPLQEPPPVLAARARDIVHNLGYTNAPATVAFGFRREDGYLEYMTRALPVSGESSELQWRRVLSRAPAPISFWYRQSAVSIVPPIPFSTVTGMPAPSYPAAGAVDAIAIDIGVDGRLLRFSAPPVSSQRDETAENRADWSTLFAAARLDITQFAPADPQSSASIVADARAAWTGIYSADSGLPVRIEGARHDGRVVLFEIVFPWTDRAGQAGTSPASEGVSSAAFVAMTVIINAAIAFVALRNWRKGRGNVRGALLIGFYAFVSLTILRLLAAPDLVDAILRRPLLTTALGTATHVAVIYLAIEPWVRRRWPHTMITWSRILAGRFRDPLVGRDVLIGLTAGVCIVAIGRIVAFVVMRAGGAPQGANSFLDAAGLGFVLENLVSTRSVLVVLMLPLYRSLFEGPSFFFVVFLFRVVFPKPWIATTAFLVFGVIATVLQTVQQSTWDASIGAFAFLLNILVILPLALRFGLVAVSVCYCMAWYTNAALLTFDLTSWYGQSSLLVLVVVSAVALWSFRVTLGRPPLTHAILAGA